VLTCATKPATRPHLSAASQQFMPSLGLRISWVFELQPGGCVVLVDAEFSLRHNPLKVTGANFREKALWLTPFASTQIISPSRMAFSQIPGFADCAKPASTRRFASTRSPENRRVSARKYNRDGRRAPAPDGAAWGECEGAQFQSTLGSRFLQ